MRFPIFTDGVFSAGSETGRDGEDDVLMDIFQSREKGIESGMWSGVALVEVSVKNPDFWLVTGVIVMSMD